MRQNTSSGTALGPSTPANPSQYGSTKPFRAPRLVRLSRNSHYQRILLHPPPLDESRIPAASWALSLYVTLLCVHSPSCIPTIASVFFPTLAASPHGLHRLLSNLDATCPVPGLSEHSLSCPPTDCPVYLQRLTARAPGQHERSHPVPRVVSA